MWTMTYPWTDNLLNAVNGAGSESAAALDGSMLALAKLDFNPTKTMEIGDFSEANYPGYARQPILTWQPANHGQGGFSLSQGESLVFQPNGDDTTNTIFGHVLIGADSVTVLGAEKYDNPVPLPDPLSALVVVPIVGLLPDGSNPSSIISP